MKRERGIAAVHPDLPEKRGKVAERVYAWVRRIPKGKVMTYGQISALLAHRVSARAVGWIMHGAPKGVPWQRVVNAQGGCSTGRLPDFPPDLQQSLLEAEGVVFDEQGKMDLETYRHRPKPR